MGPSEKVFRPRVERPPIGADKSLTFLIIRGIRYYLEGKGFRAREGVYCCSFVSLSFFLTGNLPQTHPKEKAAHRDGLKSE